MLEEWFRKASELSVSSFPSLRQTFGSADLLGNASNRVIFNIGGNDYRMICKYQVTSTEMRLYVKWIGTHEEYNQLCKLNKQYIIDLYKK